jgi:hypothetical protein
MTTLNFDINLPVEESFVKLLRHETKIVPFPVEFISEMNAPNYASGQGNTRAFYRVSHVKFENCLAGDEITTYASFEATMETVWMEFCACLVLTPDVSGVCGFNNMVSNSVSSAEEPATGRRITAFDGTNITDDIHHGRYPMAGVIKVPEGWDGDLYVAIISYVSTSYANQHADVEPFCGHLHAELNRYN